MPHYEERFTESMTEEYKDVTFEKIWAFTIDSVAEMGYVISNMDKAGGFIYGAVPSSGFAWPEASELGIAISIVIKDLKEKVVVKCQAEGKISKTPSKVFEKFFNILKNKLRV